MALFLTPFQAQRSAPAPSVQRPSLTFIDAETAKEFECSICLNVAFDPVDIGCENGHIFCNICIHRLRLESHSIHTFMCPSCRCVCNPQNIRKMPFIERQIKRLKIKCPNHSVTPRLEQLLDANKQTEEKVIVSTAERSNRRRNGRSSISIPSISNHRSRSRTRSRSRSREKEEEQKEEEEEEEEEESLCSWTGSWGDCNRHLLE